MPYHYTKKNKKTKVKKNKAMKPKYKKKRGR